MEPKGRILRNVIGPGTITIGTGTITSGEMPGYEVDPSPSKCVLAYQLNQYFDLKGYTLDDLTTYVQGVQLQKIGPYQFSQMQADSFIREWIIVHTDPLSFEDLENGDALLVPNSVPGGPNSSQGLQQIIKGWCGVYSQDAGAGFGRLIESQSWGAGNSTAADRLYYSRLFVFPKTKTDGTTNAAYSWAWPALGVVVPIIVDKEPDHEYIMRLTRSVELGS